MTQKTNFPLISLICTCLLLPLSVLAIDHPTSGNSTLILDLKQKVSQAITKLEQTKRQHWAYQVNRYENEEGDVTSSIEQYMPASELEKSWQLIRINGAKPTEKQVKKFIEKKQEQAEEQGNNFSIALRELINSESLQFIEESESHLEIGFDVYIDKLGKGSKGKLQGRLSYNKQLKFIENITIVNNDEFSPAFSANITDFKLTFSFISINDSILPQQQDMVMKGTFAFFTDIDEVSTDSYSNYRYQGL